jgi:DNA (cytosine-5)-methyltransferase 1
MQRDSSIDLDCLRVDGGIQPASLGDRHLAEQDGKELFPELLRAVRVFYSIAVLPESVHGLMRPLFQPHFEYTFRQLRCG